MLPAAKTTAVSRDVLTKLHDLDNYVKQESSEQNMRALNAVRNVAGILPAPAGTSLSTRAGASGLPAGATIVEDEYATAPPPVKAVAAVAAKPAPKPAAVAAAPAAEPEPEATGDADLDELMRHLDATAGV